MKVLIVEDEISLAKEMKDFLQKSHYICNMTHSANEAITKCEKTDYDFVLLDLGLPDKEGLLLLEEIKKDNPETIAIILTARGNVEDKIKGLEMGADDYMAKPFSLHELLARMQAVTRRKYNIKDNIIPIGDFVINTNSRIIICNDHEIELSKKEFDLLHYLILHKNRPLSRMQLSEHLWGEYAMDDYDSNYIDVHIKNIRKKLSVYAPVNWLQTIRGIGYKIKKR
ncbi:MAG: response regulator transcription factor [Niabella sp.]